MPNVLPATVGFRLVPGNYAPMKGADLHGQAQESGCGHSMDFWLKLEEGRIAAATYITDGCDNFITCGSLVAHLCLGRSLAQVRGMEAGEVLEALGDKGEPARHCTDLALRAMRAAAGSVA